MSICSHSGLQAAVVSIFQGLPGVKISQNLSLSLLFWESVAIHLTALFLLQETCELELKTYEGWTALQVACIQGYVRCVECLVGYGADVQAPDANGSTVLHIVLHEKDMKPLSNWTNHLNEVKTFTCVCVYVCDL